MRTGSELREPLSHYLKTLHLPTVRACYEEQAERARNESWIHELYLLELMETECDERRQNRIARAVGKDLCFDNMPGLGC